GHDYIDQAVAKGAVAIVCEKIPTNLPSSVVAVKVQNSAQSLGHIAANFYDNPSEKLKIVAITGTNGKTTTATLLHSLFRKMGKKTGLLSTVQNVIIDKVQPSTHTTPNAIELNRLFREMLDKDCTHCFIEASSHAIHQHRITGTNFAGAVFTNISHDHLDYHSTFNEYIKAKKALFDELPSDSFALVNNDDSHAETMLHDTKAKHRSYGLKTMADYRAKVLESRLTGLHLNIAGKELFSPIIGYFNASNLLAVYAVAMEMGLDQMDTLTYISTLTAVEGRFQHISTPGNVTAVVDYAHTPDALQNVLKTINSIRTGNEQVITVVGCGGDRDVTKRPLMAQIATELSSQVILTSDNPRSEAPDAIIEDMKKGLDPVAISKTITLADRAEAIKLACTLAKTGDIVLVAGKGHEKYQEIKGVKHTFDDMETVSTHLKMLQK
ncbi:MAG: UDP-N-acetylmuramoyl-L-alanyl-D-glutamate--2,6-diaminopimelate ligase, partial [Flavobacteriales bacterium]